MGNTSRQLQVRPLHGKCPASRLLQRLGICRSADTVLRRVKARSRRRTGSKVRVLGVDDWAWRKQQHYGTMRIDLEQGRVIDLLPVRSAVSFCEWLGSHPEVEIITRDGSSLYWAREDTVDQTIRFPHHPNTDWRGGSCSSPPEDVP